MLASSLFARVGEVTDVPPPKWDRAALRERRDDQRRADPVLAPCPENRAQVSLHPSLDAVVAEGELDRRDMFVVRQRAGSATYDLQSLVDGIAAD